MGSVNWSWCCIARVFFVSFVHKQASFFENNNTAAGLYPMLPSLAMLPNFIAVLLTNGIYWLTIWLFASWNTPHPVHSHDSFNSLYQRQVEPCPADSLVLIIIRSLWGFWSNIISYCKNYCTSPAPQVFLIHSSYWKLCWELHSRWYLETYDLLLLEKFTIQFVFDFNIKTIIHTAQITT